MDYLKRTWADISLDNLNHNYQQLRAKIPSGCRLLGVVKADAYGHGAVPISRHLCELARSSLPSPIWRRPCSSAAAASAVPS